MPSVSRVLTEIVGCWCCILRADQYGPFSRWQVNGVDASQACCSCGGGSTGDHHAPPPPSRPPPPSPQHLECRDASEVCEVITLVSGVCDEDMEQVTGDARFAGASVGAVCRVSCHTCNNQMPPTPPPVVLPPAPPSQVLKGYQACMDHLSSQQDAIGHTCCADGCPNGTPDFCTQQCAATWMPFSRHCSSFLQSDPMLALVLPLSTSCEETVYGRYNGAAALGGRCSPASEQGYQDQLTSAGCMAGKRLATHCTDECAEVFLEFCA